MSLVHVYIETARNSCTCSRKQDTTRRAEKKQITIVPDFIK